MALAPLSPAAAQRVLLEIRPRAGDTLRMRLDQQVEIVGTTRVGEADSTMRVVTSMQVLARAVVQRSDAQGAVVLSITDSVTMRSEGGRPADDLEQASRALRGTRLQLHIAPDGSAEAIGDDAGSRELRAALAQMPAALPRTPVAVGARWTRVMRLPIAGQEVPGGGAGGVLNATFRFDSLSRDGDIAYLSMRGVLTRDSTAAEMPGGMRYAMSGTMTGSLQVNRRRGWLTDSRATMTVRSVVSPPPGGNASPMRVQMRITQRMHVMDKR